MAKNGKLSKLRSIIKRWNSSTRITLTGGTVRHDISSKSTDEDEIPNGFHPIFVGKSRRRYLLSSDVFDRPIFQTLINRSSGDDGCAFVGCEVVLFEHLLWMLENADPQPELLDELIDFYSC